MGNIVETKLSLFRQDGQEIGTEEVRRFFTPYLSINMDGRDYLDLAKIIPQPGNLWWGSVGGFSNKNLELIALYGGIEVVCRGLSEEYPPFDRYRWPTLTNDQIAEFGLLDPYAWNSAHWGCDTNTFDCAFSFNDPRDSLWNIKLDDADFCVFFCTGKNAPEHALRVLRQKALDEGYDLEAEFSGSDTPGAYEDGLFMYFNGEYDEELDEIVRYGDPFDVHE